MPNTYSQIYIQIIFAVKGCQNLIHPSRCEDLHKYITGIVQNREQKMLSIFAMPDHSYINNQEEHHRKVAFKEEYLNFLQKFQVEYDEKYLFDWIE